MLCFSTVYTKEVRLLNFQLVNSSETDYGHTAPRAGMCWVGRWVITSARSPRLYTDYSYEDSGWCVAGEEEGGIVTETDTGEALVWSSPLNSFEHSNLSPGILHT